MKADKFKISPETITWPCPDPTWEYSEIWHQIQQAKQDINGILSVMEEIQTPTLDTDKAFRTLIHSVQSRLEYVTDILS